MTGPLGSGTSKAVRVSLRIAETLHSQRSLRPEPHSWLATAQVVFGFWTGLIHSPRSHPRNPDPHSTHRHNRVGGAFAPGGGRDHHEKRLWPPAADRGKSDLQRLLFQVHQHLQE